MVTILAENINNTILIILLTLGKTVKAQQQVKHRNNTIQGQLNLYDYKGHL